MATTLSAAHSSDLNQFMAATPMSERTVLYDEHDSIAVITLNQPDKLNALTNDMI